MKHQKRSQKNRQKRRKTCSKHTDNGVAGDLIYWQFNAAIKSSVGKFIDTLNTVGRTQKESAISHYVVPPWAECEFFTRNANRGSFVPSGDRSSDTVYTDVKLEVPDAYFNQKVHQWKCHIVVIEHDPLSCPAPNDNPEEWASKLSKTKMYFSEHEVEKLCCEGYDVAILLFAPAGVGADYFPYIRWIGVPFRVPSINPSLVDSKLTEYRSRLVHGGYEVMQKGGSNGEVSLNKDFFAFMHAPGTGPRQSHASLWVPSMDKKMAHFVHQLLCSQEKGCDKV
jgi:hypothetical protein